MYMQGRRLRLTAVSVMVVLALTGFSSGREQGSDSGNGHDQGGCSSSGQDHDGSAPGGSDPLGSSPSSAGSPSAAPYGSGTADSSGGGSQPTPTASPSSSATQPLKDGTAVLVSCASMEDPYATVEIRNPNERNAVLDVKVSFADEHGYILIDTGSQVSVPAKGRMTYRVPAKSKYTDRITQCDVAPVARAVW